MMNMNGCIGHERQTAYTNVATGLQPTRLPLQTERRACVESGFRERTGA